MKGNHKNSIMTKNWNNPGWGGLNRGVCAWSHTLTRHSLGGDTSNAQVGFFLWVWAGRVTEKVVVWKSRRKNGRLLTSVEKDMEGGVRGEETTGAKKDNVCSHELR